MKIGIMADSHDNLPKIRAALDLFGARGVELILHAGDFTAPFAVRAMRAPCRVVGVFGNNDGERLGLRRAFEAIGEVHPGAASVGIGGKRIAVIHSDEDGAALARSGRYDLVACGHSHKPFVRRDGACLVVNPGETGGWLTGECTVAVVELDAMEAELLPI